MIGRTPSHITAIRPLVDGVISDFEITEEMIAYLINKSQNNSKKMFGPRVLVGVPSGITNVETRAVRDAVKILEQEKFILLKSRWWLLLEIVYQLRMQLGVLLLILVVVPLT